MEERSCVHSAGFEPTTLQDGAADSVQEKESLRPLGHSCLYKVKQFVTYIKNMNKFDIFFLSGSNHVKLFNMESNYSYIFQTIINFKLSSQTKSYE